MQQGQQHNPNDVQDQYDTKSHHSVHSSHDSHSRHSVHSHHNVRLNPNDSLSRHSVRDHHDRHSPQGHHDVPHNLRDSHSHDSIHKTHRSRSQPSIHYPHCYHKPHKSDSKHSFHGHPPIVEQPTLTPKQVRDARVNRLSLMAIPFIVGIVLLVSGALTLASTMGSDEVGIPLLAFGCVCVVAAVLAFLLIYFDLCNAPSRGTKTSRIEPGIVPSSPGPEYPPPESRLKQGISDTPSVAITPAAPPTVHRITVKAVRSSGEARASPGSPRPSPGSPHPSTGSPRPPSKSLSKSRLHPHAPSFPQRSSSLGGKDVQSSMSKPLISDDHPT